MNRQQRLEKLNRTLDDTIYKANAARRGVGRVAPSVPVPSVPSTAGGPDLRKLQRSQDDAVAALKRMEQRERSSSSFAIATRRLGL